MKITLGMLIIFLITSNCADSRVFATANFRMSMRNDANSILKKLCLGWSGELINIAEGNKRIEAVKQNTALREKLKSILSSDQDNRLKIDSMLKKYGMQSKEIKGIWDTINHQDSINLIEVKQILDKYGWLGPGVVGQDGSLALFLVIQHADLATQEYYIPMFRAAVKVGNAKASHLALMEDRIAIGNQRKQIFGSQINLDMNGKYTFYPIEDEANVNKRRAEVGLEPLEEYAKRWGIDYKLPLPEKSKKKTARKTKKKLD